MYFMKIIILSPRDNIEIAVSNSSSRVSLTECIELDTWLEFMSICPHVRLTALNYMIIFII